jgi:hypothetical protein
VRKSIPKGMTLGIRSATTMEILRNILLKIHRATKTLAIQQIDFPDEGVSKFYLAQIEWKMPPENRSAHAYIHIYVRCNFLQTHGSNNPALWQANSRERVRINRA